MNESLRLSVGSLRFLAEVSEITIGSKTINDRKKVRDFVAALQARGPVFADVSAQATIRATLTTPHGHFGLDLYACDGDGGVAIGDGVAFPASAELVKILLPILGSGAAPPEPATGIPSTAQPVAPEAAAGDPNKKPVRVIFYAMDHNAVYAQTLLAQAPDSTIIVPLNDQATPQTCATALADIATTRSIVNVIFASHGVSGSFQAGRYSNDPTTPMNVGLYPNNVQPDAFGGMIRPSLAPNAIITLLSCSTAAGAVGLTMIQSLAHASGATVTAADAVVYINGPAGQATTTGNVWGCTPNAGPQLITNNPNPGVTYIVYPVPPAPAYLPAAA